jgi:hypothetical protein
MAGETVGPVEPKEPVHEVTSIDPNTGLEVTVQTSVDLHPDMNAGEAIQAIGSAILDERNKQ